MKHLERMQGAGTVISGNGNQKTVEYDLHVYEEEFSAATLEDPSARISGLKDIRGRAEPVFFCGYRDLTLEMKDGRKLKFYFLDKRGTIACLHPRDSRKK